MSIITLLKSYCDDVETELEAKDEKIAELENKIEDLEQRLAEQEAPA